MRDFRAQDGRMSIDDHTYAYERGVKMHHGVWKDMLECYDYVAGDQHTQEQKDWYEKYGLVARVANITLAQIITVDGYNLQSRFNVQAEPTQPDDSRMAGKITEVLQWQYRECAAHDQIRKINSDATICGVGYRYDGWRVEYRDMANGLLEVSRVSPFDTIDDLNDPDGTNSKIGWRLWTRWFSPDRLIQIDAQDDEALAREIESAAERLQGSDHRRAQRERYFSVHQYNNQPDYRVRTGLGVDPVNWKKASDYFDPASGLYRRLEFHYQRPKQVVILIDPVTGKVYQIPDSYVKDSAALAFICAQLNLPTEALKDTYVNEWRVSVSYPGLIRAVIKDVAYDVQDEGCAIKEVLTYSYDHRRTKRRGIVHAIRDLQDTANRDISIMEDIKRRALHPDIIIEDGAVAPKHIQTWKSKQVARLLVYNGNKKPPAIFNQNLPAQLFNADVSMNLDLAPRITGITPTLGGMKDAKKDGAALFGMMVDQGLIMMEPILAEQAKVFEEAARYDLKLVQKNMIYPQWIRVLGPNGETDLRNSFMVNQYDPDIQRAKDDVTVGRYDMRLSRRRDSKNEMLTRFEMKTQIMAMLPQMVKDLTLPSWIDDSTWADSALYKRAIEIYLHLTYGPEVLAAISDDALKEQLLQQIAMDPMKRAQLTILAQSMERGDMGGLDLGSGRRPGFAPQRAQESAA